MPVVIEEMTVQVEVNQTQNGSALQQAPPAGGGTAGNPQTEVIRKCVEEVMEVLRHQNER